MDDDGILQACTTNWRVTSARTIAKTNASTYSRTMDLACRGLMLFSWRWPLPIFMVNPCTSSLMLPWAHRTLCSVPKVR